MEEWRAMLRKGDNRATSNMYDKYHCSLFSAQCRIQNDTSRIEQNAESCKDCFCTWHTRPARARHGSTHKTSQYSTLASPKSNGHLHNNASSATEFSQCHHRLRKFQFSKKYLRIRTFLCHRKSTVISKRTKNDKSGI